MQHPAELKLHQYLSGFRTNQTKMRDETIEQIVQDVRAALVRQFADGKSREFSLRMSNVGRPECQLWFEKNEPTGGVPRSTNFIINMMIGDIVEAVFKGLLTEAGVSYSNGEKVTLKVGSHEIHGTPDIVIDGAVDDIKSASPWSYENKFKDFATLDENDSFGYVAQLAGYAMAMNVKPGGWWVVNKASGEFKYVAADGIDLKKEAAKIEATADAIQANAFERNYDAIDETYRGKPTGNKVLCRDCQWCDYRYKCWPTLQEMPSVKSRAEKPPMVSYVHLEAKE